MVYRQGERQSREPQSGGAQPGRDTAALRAALPLALAVTSAWDTSPLCWLLFVLHFSVGFTSLETFPDPVDLVKGLSKGGWKASWRRWQRGASLKEE